MRKKTLFRIFLFLSLFSQDTVYGQAISEIKDAEGKIFLTDRSGETWRCYATGTGLLPLQCRRAGEADGVKIEVEKIESHFAEDKEGNKYPVRY